MKNRIILPILLSALMLTACGSSDNSESYYKSSPASNSFTQGASDSLNSGGSMYDAAEGSYDYADADTETEINSNGASSANPEKTQNTSSDVIQKEMLVYSCNMSIDVLDFPAAIEAFRNSLTEYGAFVETENYSDGGSSSRWYYSDGSKEKWQSYSATVRVPSEKYDSFCTQASSLGDLRSKSASVENLSREYYDLSAALEIYEAKEKRYMDLLKTIVDEEYAIAVEKELTEIQIEISKLRTRMNVISTDVAYSYVYITVNEVKEYIAEPVKTDTFFQRVSNAVSESAANFLEFTEGLLIVFIHLFPHLIIIGIIVFIIIKAVRSSKKRKAAKAAAMPAPVQTAPSYTAPAAPNCSAPVSSAASNDLDLKEMKKETVKTDTDNKDKK